MRCLQKISFLCAITAAFLSANARIGAAEEVRHPNLLLNREEIEQIKVKIRDQKWAAALFERVKALADDMLTKGAHQEREAALIYALTGEKKYADTVRKLLLQYVRDYQTERPKVDMKVNPEWSAWTPFGERAWAYDLTYDAFTPEERILIEDWFRQGCQTIIEGEKLWTTTPNLVFGKHFNVGLVGYAIGDKELIEWGLNDPGAHGPRRGGFYQVMDSMIVDGHFWGEAPIYAIAYDVHGMLALAEAALHYDGTDLYHFVSKTSNASIKSIIDGYLRLGYPLEQTGIGGGSVRMATFGDGSTGYTPRGELAESYVINPVEWHKNPPLAGELEVAYKRYKDTGYAWLLSLSPKRDANIVYGRAALGYIALTHGEVLPEKPAPPQAPSGIYPGQGFALLRADESPSYWTSGALAAVVMMGKQIGHGHSDDYSVTLHGKGRLLYPDINVIQYEPSYLNWTHEGIAHNTLLVDHQSPTHGPFTTRQDLGEDVKFFSITGSAYQGVRQTRSILLTKEYMADFFQAADTETPARARVFDWVLHGLGRLYVGNPGAYRPTDRLVPYYWWIDNERSRTTDATFQADWIQRSAGITPGLQNLGKEWFDHEVGVRMTMLGSAGTEVYAGDGPLTNGPPYHRIEGNPEGTLPMLVVRREAPAALFASVHEPYEGQPRIQRVRRLAETGSAALISIQSEDFTDYMMAAFDDNPHTLAAESGETFTFTDYGFLRVEKEVARAQGKVSGFRIPSAALLKHEALINGKIERLKTVEHFLMWGKISDPPAAQAGDADNPPERSASVHCRFQPEEVHLAAGGETEVELHLRAIGEGQTKGQFRLSAPKGLEVEPTQIAIDPMGRGQERTVRFKVHAAKDAPSAAREIRVLPEDGLQAATQTLLVTNGVVMTLDNRIPKGGQFIIRAPGYSINVDHYSAVGQHLLDADGHRRFGNVVTGNFTTGFPGLAFDGKWSFNFGMPCEGLWTSTTGLKTSTSSLTVRSLGLGGAPNARLLYTFEDNRIVIKIVPPTDTSKEFTMWLGNFDVLGKPVHNGKQEQPWSPIVGDRFFFPHPTYRQGVLLITPPKTPVQLRGDTAVSFPIRAGQQVTLQFAEPAEAQKE